MCGIAGAVAFGETDVRRGTIEAMTASLRHRGPDHQGVVLLRPPDRLPCRDEGSVALGTARLAVLDLSPAANQPMSNEDGSLWISFNGEIYNFRELAEELGLAGSLRTGSDTEVILHAFRRWGAAALKRLNGMFGLAICDLDRGELLLARDRIGIKPLYYSVEGNRLLFGSELKALLAGGVESNIDPDALLAYLTYGYVPAPLCFVAGVHKLPPAHYLRVRLRDGREELERYWQLQPQQEPASISFEDAKLELVRRLRRSVKLRKVSDVPLGVFLSGGLDSSAITALLAEVSESPVNTFSVGFRERSFSELHRARRVAKLYSTNHRERVIEPQPQESLQILAHHFDEPFADHSAIAVLELCRVAREEMTVCLGGDGGDEIFAGYPVYRAHRLARQYRKLPAFLNRGFLPWLANKLPAGRHKLSFSERARRFTAAALQPPELAHVGWKRVFSSEQINKMLHPDLRKTIKRLQDPAGIAAGVFTSTGCDEEVSAAQFCDLSLYLPDDILTKLDRASMAVSLEARVPLLDHEVMEFAFSLPCKFHMRGGRQKSLLKAAFSDLLPRENVYGRKQGFNVPMADWLRGALKEPMLDALNPQALSRSGILNQEAVSPLIEEHIDCRANHGHRLFSLVALQLWCQTHMK